jgi:hypothetical protein
MEETAARIVGMIESPIAYEFFDGDRVDWTAVNDSYDMLSGGEKALVNLAKHLSNRAPAKPNTGFTLALCRLDADKQAQVVRHMLALLGVRTTPLEDAQRIIDEGRGRRWELIENTARQFVRAKDACENATTASKIATATAKRNEKFHQLCVALGEPCRACKRGRCFD